MLPTTHTVLRVLSCRIIGRRRNEQRDYQPGAKGHVPARSFQYGVVVAEILKQRRKRTQPMADARADKASVASPFAKSFTPRDDMRARHEAEFFRRLMPVNSMKSLMAFS